jgi:hypothetical protein
MLPMPSTSTARRGHSPSHSDRISFQLVARDWVFGLGLVFSAACIPCDGLGSFVRPCHFHNRGFHGTGQASTVAAAALLPDTR